jgi:YafQ family addiction module toxin component
MHNFDRSDKLIKILKKLFKKDKVRYEATLKKIQEVISSEDPNHYKNLSYDLSDFKGVHIDTHFILIFKVDNSAKSIKFEDLKHHDEAYQR